MTTLTTIGLIGFVGCVVLFLVALAGQSDGMWGDTQTTGPTVKRFLVQSQKVFAVIGIACGLLAVVSALLGG